MKKNTIQDNTNYKKRLTVLILYRNTQYKGKKPLSKLAGYVRVGQKGLSPGFKGFLGMLRLMI